MPSLKSSIGINQHISLDDVCYLIFNTTVKDELGQDVRVEATLRQIFCSKTSVNRAEFLAAGQLDYKPQVMLLVDLDEYDQEKSLQYIDKKYSIYRTFMRPDGFIELYCEVKVGG